MLVYVYNTEILLFKVVLNGKIITDQSIIIEYTFTDLYSSLEHRILCFQYIVSSILRIPQTLLCYKLQYGLLIHTSKKIIAVFLPSNPTSGLTVISLLPWSFKQEIPTTLQGQKVDRLLEKGK